jgi:DNA integrity scanning protein DisA with diadenylate cyclase activity
LQVCLWTRNYVTKNRILMQSFTKRTTAAVATLMSHYGDLGEIVAAPVAELEQIEPLGAAVLKRVWQQPCQRVGP